MRVWRIQDRGHFEVRAVIRALIVLECVLLIILALDRVVGVPASGVNIDRAAREREISRHVTGNVQGG